MEIINNICRFFALCFVASCGGVAFIETYSTPQAMFNVVNAWLESSCDALVVRRAALQTEEEWRGYVYGPKPGVPCAREQPHYRSQAWCNASGCRVDDISRDDWDALQGSIQYSIPKKRPLI